MDAVRNVLHAVGELLGVCNQRVVVAGIAAVAPAIVEDHIVVAQVFETVIDDQSRGLEQEFF